MDDSYLADIERISDAAIKGRLVVFVGAGVSKNSGALDWIELIDSLKKELPDELKSDSDFLKIAQLYKDERGDNEYLKKIRLELKHEELRYNGIDEAIFDLNPVHVITTNYDNLLEQVIVSNNLQYFKICQDKDLPYSNYNQFLIKMHGDLEKGNIVLTEDDYINYENNFPLISSFVKSLFSSKLILFVGFSFNDYNLKIILSKVKNLLQKDFQIMYLIQVHNSSYIQKEYLKKRGVKVVEYDESIMKITENSLNKVENSILGEIKDIRGKKLYYFLKFIHKFDEIKLKNANFIELLTIVNDLINKYSDEITVIGGESISSFLTKKNIVSSYSDFLLITSLESYKNLEFHLKDSISNKRNFVKNNIDAYRSIQKFLVQNQVFAIASSQKGQKANAISSIRHFNKSEYEKTGVSLLLNLELKKLVDHIGKLKQRDAPNVNIGDLELPYLLYKIGKFYEAYKIYDDLSNKYWQAKKYVLFYICQLNIKSLSAPIRNENFYGKGGVTYAELDFIEDKIKKIDLNRLIRYISNDNEVIVKALKEFIDFDHIHRNIYDIDKLILGVKEAKSNSERGGFNTKNYATSILSKALRLWNVSNSNYIISDYYTEHNHIYLLSFEGLIISNNIRNAPIDVHWGTTPRLKKIEAEYLQLALFISDHEKLIKIFSSNNIHEIDISLEAYDYLSKSLENLIELDDFFYKDEYFSEFILTYTSNLLILLTKINSGEKLINKTVELLTKFAKFDFNLLLTLDKPIRYFIVSANGFEGELLEIFLNEYLNNKGINPANSNTISRVIKKLAYINSQLPTKKNIHLPMISKILKQSLGNINSYSQILYIVQFLSPRQCKQIKNMLETYLGKVSINMNFVDVFIRAYFYKLLDNSFNRIFIDIIVNDPNTYLIVSHMKNLTFMVLSKIYYDSDDVKLKEDILSLSIDHPLLKLMVTPSKFTDFLNLDREWIDLLSESEEGLTAASSISSFKDRLLELIKQFPADQELVNIYTKLY